jgi:hypothetical protein
MNTTSGSEGDDPLQEARAYNRSIYLMVSMPYLLLGAIGFAVYRGMRTAGKRLVEGADTVVEDIAFESRPEAAGTDRKLTPPPEPPA